MPKFNHFTKLQGFQTNYYPSMQKILNAAMMLLIIGLACCDKAGVQDEAREISEIKALSATRAKAFNEGNADDIAIAFTESGILMAPDMTSMTGREAVRGYYQRIFDQYRTFLESGYEEVKVSGNLAYGVGYAKVKLVPHNGGDTLVSTAKYINILQRQDDGSWLTTYDIWNANE
jgi:uncharacterized protein (TIGR02246 family)